MKSKNIPFNPKKIPYYLALSLLTAGASLILGFLSFSGMFALFPILSLAVAAFGLSVAYEGEIYLQNIKGALAKLFKFNYLKNHLAKDYLLTMFPENTKDEGCPQFFRDYEIQLKLLAQFGHKKLNKKSAQRKKQIEKTLKDMEKWFALQLFPNKNTALTQSAYAKELHQWLANHKQDEWQNRLEKRNLIFYGVKAFSLLAGAFMGVGTTYLIVEAFTVIPIFAAIPFGFWPIMVVPMALVAGAAYGFLTYNTIVDFINNDTINKWYQKLRNDWKQGVTPRNVFMTVTAVLLVALAITLTICTAGTWWTVATKARPLFEWMTKIPSFVMGIVNPIITGLSAIFFNVQNTSESLEMIDQGLNSKQSIWQRIKNAVVGGYKHLRETENWWQILNPFRILLKLTVTPLRILLFIGHLISIGVTSDRMPGVPQVVAALIAIISEGFEDVHYFIGHSHDDEDEHGHHHDIKSLLKEHLDSSHGHNHNADIPTVILKALFTPLYFLATTWDYFTSKMNVTQTTNTAAKHPEVLSFAKAWNKQRGEEEEVEVTLKKKKEPSENWQKEHTISLIEKHKTKHLEKTFFGKELATEKIQELTQLQKNVRNGAPLKETLETAKKQPSFSQHRLFGQFDEPTATENFIEELPERVNAV